MVWHAKREAMVPCSKPRDEFGRIGTADQGVQRPKLILWMPRSVMGADMACEQEGFLPAAKIRVRWPSARLVRVRGAM